ncbi:hypothetical protein C8J56DRAFT_1019591 [Mycena floridula]|nr:hypothetical protein C8J56DRAFT_1019591 [Mycena floridula]
MPPRRAPTFGSQRLPKCLEIQRPLGPMSIVLHWQKPHVAVFCGLRGAEYRLSAEFISLYRITLSKVGRAEDKWRNYTGRCDKQIPPTWNSTGFCAPESQLMLSQDLSIGAGGWDCGIGVAYLVVYKNTALSLQIAGGQGSPVVCWRDGRDYETDSRKYKKDYQEPELVVLLESGSFIE